MEELSRDFVEAFKTELVSGLINKGKQARTLEEVRYEVTKDKVNNKGVVVTVTLSVGGLVVFEKKHYTTYGSDVEVSAAQVIAIRAMINEIPYIYKAVVSHVKGLKEKTLKDKALEAMVLIKDVFNEIGKK